jgi:hypothetical protein
LELGKDHLPFRRTDPTGLKYAWRYNQYGVDQFPSAPPLALPAGVPTPPPAPAPAPGPRPAEPQRPAAATSAAGPTRATEVGITAEHVVPTPPVDAPVSNPTSADIALIKAFAAGLESVAP